MGGSEDYNEGLRQFRQKFIVLTIQILVVSLSFLGGYQVRGNGLNSVGNKTPVIELINSQTKVESGGDGYQNGQSFEVRTTNRSHFSLDENGSLIPETRGDKNYFKVGETINSFNQRLENK